MLFIIISTGAYINPVRLLYRHAPSTAVLSNGLSAILQRIYKALTSLTVTFYTGISTLSIAL